MLVSLKMAQLQSVICVLSLTERDLLSLWHSQELRRLLAELEPGNWPSALGLQHLSSQECAHAAA